MNYVVHAKVRDAAAQDAHDCDSEFRAFDRKAGAFQVEGP